MTDLPLFKEVRQHDAHGAGVRRHTFAHHVASPRCRTQCPLQRLTAAYPPPRACAGSPTTGTHALPRSRGCAASTATRPRATTWRCAAPGSATGRSTYGGFAMSSCVAVPRAPAPPYHTLALAYPQPSPGSRPRLQPGNRPLTGPRAAGGAAGGAFRHEGAPRRGLRGNERVAHVL